MRRVRRLEAEIETTAADPLLDDSVAAKLDRLARYYTRHERSYHRALKELRLVQTNRMLRDTLGLGESAKDLPVLVSIPEMARQHAQRNQNLVNQQLYQMEADLRRMKAARQQRDNMAAS